MKTVRHIFRCQSKTCRHVWAHDYEVHNSSPPRIIRKARFSEGRVMHVDPGWDKRQPCPACGKRGATGFLVSGTLSPSHKCDSRCWDAKGNHCVCACGGARHGEAHVVKDMVI